MQTLTQQILQKAAHLEEGTPLGAKELLHLGSRASLDQAFSRLVRRGQLMRVGRGVYVRPVETRFGIRAPATEKLVEGLANARGEVVVPHGAAAANTLGLTTQVPTRTVYLTSGASCRLKLGAQIVELKHVPRWQLVKKGRRAGEAVRALAWLGPTHVRSALAALKQRLPAGEIAELVATRAALPEWLAKSMSVALLPNG